MRRPLWLLTCLSALGVTLTGCTLFSDPNTLTPTTADIAQWRNQAGLTVSPRDLTRPEPMALVRFKGLQATNKSQACQVPVPVGVAEKSVKVYWDGECAKGWATGLGRALVLGPDTHLEAITIFEPEHPNAARVAVIRDVKRQETFRGTVSPDRLVGEKETLVEANGDAFRDFTLRLNEGNVLYEATRSTMTPTEVTTHVVDGRVEVHHEHDADGQGADDVTDLYWYGPNSRLTENVPFRVTRHGREKTYVRQNGTVRPVTMPPEVNFWAPMDRLLAEASVPLNEAQTARDAAKRLEADYLSQLARQDRAVPKGLDRQTFLGILDYAKTFEAKEALTQMKLRKEREEALLRMAKLRALRAEEAAQRAWENRAWFYRSPFTRCYQTSNGLFCTPW